MNSWDLSDTEDGVLGERDLSLSRRLAHLGGDHAKFRRMIAVYCDILAPLYWWKEFDTYKVGTVANSCSTMHKIQAKEFTVDDFSKEHLILAKGDSNENPQDTFTAISIDGGTCLYSPMGLLLMICQVLNHYREEFIKTKDKKYWWQMIQLLPDSYNQKRTVMLNYEVLSRMYLARWCHKLDEWREMCAWIETLPYAHELIITV